MKLKYFCILLLLLLPSQAAWAAEPARGAPAFLLISFSLFTMGLVWTALSEAMIYKRYLGYPFSTSFGLSLGVNLISGLVVGIGLPFAVAFISGILGFLPGGIGDIFLILGTWVLPGEAFTTISIWLSLPWLVVSFFCAVRLEEWYLRRQFQLKSFKFLVSAKKVVLTANIVSYSGLLLAGLLLYLSY